MVPLFETCGTEIHPEFIQKFLPRTDVSIFPSCGFRYLAFLELSTRSVHCAPKENDRPSEQTVLCFTSVRQSTVCCFLNSLFGELTRRIVLYLDTVKSIRSIQIRNNLTLLNKIQNLTTTNLI